jgi:hypothetical protein
VGLAAVGHSDKLETTEPSGQVYEAGGGGGVGGAGGAALIGSWGAALGANRFVFVVSACVAAGPRLNVLAVAALATIGASPRPEIVSMGVSLSDSRILWLSGF